MQSPSRGSFFMTRQKKRAVKALSFHGLRYLRSSQCFPEGLVPKRRPCTADSPYGKVRTNQRRPSLRGGPTMQKSYHEKQGEDDAKGDVILWDLGQETGRPSWFFIFLSWFSKQLFLPPSFPCCLLLQHALSLFAVWPAIMALGMAITAGLLLMGPGSMRMVWRRHIGGCRLAPSFAWSIRAIARAWRCASPIVVRLCLGVCWIFRTGLLEPLQILGMEWWECVLTGFDESGLLAAFFLRQIAPKLAQDSSHVNGSLCSNSVWGHSGRTNIFTMRMEIWNNACRNWKEIYCSRMYKRH